jgi:glucose/arabinose dehydrogenase/type 1 glutamine amidotransferase
MRYKANSFKVLRRHARRLAIEPLEPRTMLAAFDVLVFSKTAGFRHDSIDEGIAAIQSLGAANDFSVTATEDANAFNAANLANFEAVIFLNTTGDILNATQQTAFEQYIQAGGGWVGIHAAADTEYSWTWYGGLLGAYFESHPAIQQATVVVADHVHPSTAHLPERWVRTDEWYNYQANPRGNVHVLATLSESTYTGGADGFDHPIAWRHDYDGGRAWYTGLGHTDSSFSEPLYREHLLGGILDAAGQIPSDGGATVDANYRKVVLEPDVLNPMSLAVAPDGRVFVVERGGAVKIYNPATNSTNVAAQLNVYTGGEHGLLGIALDPNFAANGWLYLFWSPNVAASDQRLSRFTLVGNQLDLSSQKILLSFHTDRFAGAGHEAGSLAFGPGGELYISTGDDTDPFESNGFTPIDERPGRIQFDAQRTSANVNDLRGKILRIMPQPDGTYTIPPGNLFPANGSAGRPEIYVMGSRNPFRISIDPETGWLYWGDVGPDASSNNSARGPRGYDELNQARGAGNFGWPYVIADNQAYRDYDFATLVSGPAFNPAAPVNNSPNNTGSADLPAAQSALVWYPYSTSPQFPELAGSGGRTIMAGPVYHFDESLNSAIKLPAYYDDTLLIYDWSRLWIKEVKLDANGNILKINPFAADIPLARPMDMELGPDGALYVLEWGTGFGGNNEDAQLVRIEFLGSPTIVSADFDANGVVDGTDFLSWQRGLGIPGAADRSDGDANADGRVDAADLQVWRDAFNTPAAVSAAAPAVSRTTIVDAALDSRWAGLTHSQPSTDFRAAANDRYLKALADKSRYRDVFLARDALAPPIEPGAGFEQPRESYQELTAAESDAVEETSVFGRAFSKNFGE